MTAGRFLSFFAATLALAQTPAAKRPIHIDGTVVDNETNAPIANAKVTMEASENTDQQVTTSDPNGRFSFNTTWPAESPFPGLPLMFQAAAPGYLAAVSDTAPGIMAMFPFRGAVTITHDESKYTTEVRLTRVASLSGVLIDQDSKKPITKLTVTAQRRTYQRGEAAYHGMVVAQCERDLPPGQRGACRNGFPCRLDAWRNQLEGRSSRRFHQRAHGRHHRGGLKQRNRAPSLSRQLPEFRHASWFQSVSCANLLGFQHAGGQQLCVICGKRFGLYARGSQFSHQEESLGRRHGGLIVVDPADQSPQDTRAPSVGGGHQMQRQVMLIGGNSSSLQVECVDEPARRKVFENGLDRRFLPRLAFLHRKQASNLALGRPPRE